MQDDGKWVVNDLCSRFFPSSPLLYPIQNNLTVILCIFVYSTNINSKIMLKKILLLIILFAPVISKAQFDDLIKKLPYPILLKKKILPHQLTMHTLYRSG